MMRPVPEMRGKPRLPPGTFLPRENHLLLTSRLLPVSRRAGRIFQHASRSLEKASVVQATGRWRRHSVSPVGGVSVDPNLRFFLYLPPPPRSTLFPYTTLFR